jgi:hypothetical protein
MGFVLLAIVAVVIVGTTIGGVLLQRRRETPLRREVRSKAITFRISLPQVKERQSIGFPRWLALNSIMALYVRGDAFEISSTIPPFRVIIGVEYYFRAPETTIEVTQEPSALSKMDWIVVTGRRDGEEVKLAITTRDPSQLHESWNALAAAGSVPIGPPPGRPHLTMDGLPGG